ncbi:MAG: metallophosphoesterase [Solirubrobacterales bacterium]|nr:metallophosphoesterase [Solirubrobacterales bacterium]
MSRRRRTRSSTERGALAAAGVALAALLARAAWFEPRRLVVTEHDLELPGWPPALDGLRLALVSDLHAGGPQVDQATIGRVVERINAERPDLVAMLGDAIDANVLGGRPVGPDAVGRELAGLEAPLGAVAVLGNHDWSNDGPGVLRALREAGLTVLQNETVELRFRDTTFCVAGLGDVQARSADVYATLREVPAQMPLLVLSHNPDAFPQVPARASLTVSGHTHGGQIDLPLLRGRAIPSRYGDRYARGHVVENGRHLFVTSGIGTSRWPVRLRRPPEIAVLRLGSLPR